VAWLRTAAAMARRASLAIVMVLVVGNEFAGIMFVCLMMLQLIEKVAVSPILIVDQSPPQWKDAREG
jgi:hypothetical protein